MKDPRSVGIVSSGDAAKDQEEIARFLVADDRIERGLCPNGCGGMIEEDSHNASCPACGFALYQHGGLRFDHGTPQ